MKMPFIAGVSLSIVLTLGATGAYAATHKFLTHCCNDGPSGDCAPGLSGARGYADAWANFHQAVIEAPFTDFIWEGGEQHGCSGPCQCSISEQRRFTFEYHQLIVDPDPAAVYKRTVVWTACSIAT